MPVTRGQQFTHHRFIDPTWRQPNGVSAREAPKARMVITAVRQGTVYYGYAGQTRGAWHMPVTDFLDEYGDQVLT